MNPTHLDAIEHELNVLLAIIADANQQWANEHEGHRLIDLGWVSVKLNTAREHVSELRKESGWINQQPKERQPNEAKKRAPQTRRTIQTFTRDSSSASHNIEVQGRNTATRERPYPGASIRTLIANGVISPSFGEDRATGVGEDKGGTQ